MAFDEKTGKLTVSVSLREGEGRRVVGDARGHELATDVYAAWGGTDTAPTPLETLAFALGSCVVTTARAMANKAGLPVSSISATVEGAIDTAAARRPESGVRMGFPGLSVVVDIEGDITDDAKRGLLGRVLACCPVCDTVGAGTALSVVLRDGERHSLPSTAAVCGLYCEGCSLFIATNDDPERLKRIAAMYGMTEAQASCRGCRSDKHGPYCATCAMKPCAEERGVDFCGECPEYPCPTLEAFQAERPHRRDLWKDLDRIREVGWVTWSKEARKEYECPRCGAINSAYDPKCRSCGREPSCGYVARHGDAVRAFLAKK